MRVFVEICNCIHAYVYVSVVISGSKTAMHCCVYISLTQYTIENIFLLLKISFSSRDFVLIECHHPVTAPDSNDAKRLLTSTGKQTVACSTAAKLDPHWINSGLCPAHGRLSVSGGVASAGFEAHLPHNNWMRLNPSLIDSRVRESARLRSKHPLEHFFIQLFQVETLLIPLATLSWPKQLATNLNIYFSSF